MTESINKAPASAHHQPKTKIKTHFYQTEHVSAVDLGIHAQQCHFQNTKILKEFRERNSLKEIAFT